MKVQALQLLGDENTCLIDDNVCLHSSRLLITHFGWLNLDNGKFFYLLCHASPALEYYIVLIVPGSRRQSKPHMTQQSFNGQSISRFENGGPNIHWEECFRASLLSFHWVSGRQGRLALLTEEYALSLEKNQIGYKAKPLEIGSIFSQATYPKCQIRLSQATLNLHLGKEQQEWIRTILALQLHSTWVNGSEQQQSVYLVQMTLFRTSAMSSLISYVASRRNRLKFLSR